MFKYKLLFLIFFYIFFPLYSSEVDNNLNFSFKTGPSYCEIFTNGYSDSESYITNMVAKIQTDWEFMDHFFLSASGLLPVLKENGTEKFFVEETAIQKNSFKYGESNLKIFGGLKIFSLFSPYLGFAFSQLDLNRSVHEAHPYALNNEQKINAYDYLLGFKGNFDFGDYTSLGYSLTYQTSNEITAQYNEVNYENIDNYKVLSEIFLNYWLPNEYMQIGLHVYGGRYLYNKDVSADQLLPDTDIRFVGAFLSFKLSL